MTDDNERVMWCNDYGPVHEFMDEPDPRARSSTPYVLKSDADHYKRQRDLLLEAVKLAKQTMDSTLLQDGHGIDPNHPAMRQINAAITECDDEARNENDIARTQVPDAPHLRKKGA